MDDFEEEMFMDGRASNEPSITHSVEDIIHTHTALPHEEEEDSNTTLANEPSTQQSISTSATNESIVIPKPVALSSLNLSLDLTLLDKNKSDQAKSNGAASSKQLVPTKKIVVKKVLKTSPSKQTVIKEEVKRYYDNRKKSYDVGAVKVNIVKILFERYLNHTCRATCSRAKSKLKRSNTRQSKSAMKSFHTRRSY